MYELYREYLEYTGNNAWWKADGDFTIEDFLGMWILFESVGGTVMTWIEQGNWVSTAVAQNLFVGGWNDPMGPSSNAVFNFMSSWLDGASGLKKGPNEEVIQMYARNSGLDDAQAFMKKLGHSALHPTELNFDRMGAASIWGNIKGASTIESKLPGNKRGPADNSAYYTPYVK